MFTIDDIYNAYTDCIKRKKSSKDYLEYILKYGEKDLYDLLDEINTRNYTIRPSTCFIATTPKLREIFAADFRDRIVHHLVVKMIEPYFEKRFSESVYSCRVGKGSILGIQHLFHTISGLSSKENYYYLQMDIKSFFMSINKQVLYDIIQKQAPKAKWEHQETLFYLLKLIIFNDSTIGVKKVGDAQLFAMIPPNKTLFKVPKAQGLPIGNLTSQFFANVYLNELDQYIKRTLRAKYYFRYVDDFILIAKKQELEILREKITLFLKHHLKLDIATQKTKLFPINYDIDFIGYVIKDKSYIVPRKRNINALKQVLYKKNLSSQENSKKTLASINSYFGILKHSNSYTARQKFSHQIADKCIFQTFPDYSKVQLETQIYHILDSKETTTMQKYKQIKQQFKHHIIFVQIGCFYKSFDNEAIFIASKLGLKLTLFNPKTKAEAIMCGFHEKYRDKYIEKLEEGKINYVILNQKKDEKGVISREVFQTTLFDETFYTPIASIAKINQIKSQYFDEKMKKNFLLSSKNSSVSLCVSSGIGREKEFLDIFKSHDFLRMNPYEVLSFIYEWKHILTSKSD